MSAEFDYEQQLVAWEQLKALRNHGLARLVDLGRRFHVDAAVRRVLTGRGGPKTWKYVAPHRRAPVLFQRQMLKWILPLSALSGMSGGRFRGKVLRQAGRAGARPPGYAVVIEAIASDLSRVPVRVDSLATRASGRAAYALRRFSNADELDFSVLPRTGCYALVVSLVNLEPSIPLLFQAPDDGEAVLTAGGGGDLAAQTLQKAAKGEKGEALGEWGFDLEAGVHHYLRVAVTDAPQAAVGDAALLAAVELFDGRGAPMVARLDGWQQSPYFNNHCYLAVPPDANRTAWLALKAPPGAARCRLTLHRWDAVDDQLRLADVRAGILTPTKVQQALQAGEVCGEAFLQLAERLCLERGEATLRRDVLVHCAAQRKPESQRLFGVADRLTELSPQWLPELPPAYSNQRARCTDPAGRLTVCHLHKVSYPQESSGGAVRNINIVVSQQAAGLDPYVITPLWYPEARQAAQTGVWREAVRGVDHYRLTPAASHSRSVPLSKRLQYETYLSAAIVASRGAGIIHAASGVRGYELALKGLALAKAFRRPLVYEVRSFHEHTWGGAPEVALTAEMTRLRMGQEDRCMQQADRVVVISYAMREVLAARGVDPAKVRVIPNAVDLDLFRPESTAAEARQRLGLAGRRVVGYVSNMSWREGHDTLLTAFAALAHRYGELHCLLVGDGPERRRLEALAAELGVADRVTFTGEVDHSRVKTYYEAIDVFVVPRKPDYASDYVTPMKPYEVMALGRPLIVSDRPSLTEIVGEDGQRGLRFEAGQAADLAAKVEMLLADEQLARTLAESAQDWVRKERNWQRNASKMVELYDELLHSVGEAR